MDFCEANEEYTQAMINSAIDREFQFALDFESYDPELESLEDWAIRQRLIRGLDNRPRWFREADRTTTMRTDLHER